MKALIVARRELGEQRNTFLAALAAGLLVLGFTRLPGAPPSFAADPHMAAMLVALFLAWVLAAFYGAAMLGRDLQERRLGFYLARPLPLESLFAGKLLAGIALALGAAALAMVPAFIVHPGDLWELKGGLPFFSFMVIGALVALPLGHAASVAFRSRSSWLLLDLTALPLLAALLWKAVAGLLRALPHENGGRLLWALAGAAALLMAVAGLVALRTGRGDLARTHRGLSLALVPLLAALALGAWGGLAWVRSATPSDLLAVTRREPAYAGSWARISGPARARGGYRPRFLVDGDSGRWLRAQGYGPVVFSGDGRRAAWLDFRGGAFGPLTWELHVAELGSSPAALSAGTLESLDMPRLALSPDGRYVALAYRDRLLVCDADTTHVLVSVPYPQLNTRRLLFLRTNRIRIFNASTEAEELDLATGRLAPTQQLNAAGGCWLMDS